MSDQRIDHILRSLWTAQEESRNNLEYIRELYSLESFDEVLAQMLTNRLVKLEHDKVYFAPRGQRLAEEIIRRYRLAERLFADVFEAHPSDYERLACSFEHVISPEVTDSVCTFLGHPLVCPHDRKIPRGKCCTAYLNDLEPLVQPLVTLPVGQRARIVYMVPAYKKRWEKLHQLGIFPGNSLRLIQKKPSFVIEVGETNLALDDEICRDIYVKKLNG